MKASKLDYLSIAGALLAILLCGYGIGFLVGERTTQKRLQMAEGSGEVSGDWVQETVERLQRELELTPEQRLAVEAEVRRAADEVGDARKQAVLEYQRALLRLHERLLPHLDEKQHREVERSKKSLENMLDKSG